MVMFMTTMVLVMATFFQAKFALRSDALDSWVGVSSPPSLPQKGCGLRRSVWPDFGFHRADPTFCTCIQIGTRKDNVGKRQGAKLSPGRLTVHSI